MSAEEWRQIPGYPGYEVSNRGRVRSHLKYHGSFGPRILRQPPDRDGYPQVHLRDASGRDPVVKVHILVAVAFLGERQEGQEARHLDGDPANNRLTNLRYGTSSENSLDQVRHGTHAFARRTHCKHNHEYTPENTAIHTSSKGRPYRQCKTCHAAKMRRRREAKRTQAQPRAA